MPNSLWISLHTIPRPDPQAQALTVTLYSRQSFVRLSRAAWAALGEPAVVEVVCDLAGRRIGFRAAAEGYTAAAGHPDSGRRRGVRLCCAEKLRRLLTGAAWPTAAQALPLTPDGDLLIATLPAARKSRRR